MKEISKAKRAIEEIKNLEKYYKSQLTIEEISYLKFHFDKETEVLKQPFINVAAISFGAFVVGLMITQAFKENFLSAVFILSVIFLVYLGIMGSMHYSKLKYYTIRKHITEKILNEVEQKEPLE
ncbi:hypothetical protein [Paenibacillus borealis]|uniref:Uncharacterized protein n=1 Tax=Paenibacillus borealis TaxID=160799 RepID=A0A089MT84_PAEBO|nr:hypothetical protein [Paenibacillus borealis]AIQ59674.1 hypothetical protein PBOR_23990 [Paenibacillus borealis]